MRPMIKYTDKLKNVFMNCTNPRNDIGVSYNVMWNILDDREVSIKTILKIMERTKLKLEDCIKYVKD